MFASRIGATSKGGQKGKGGQQGKEKGKGKGGGGGGGQPGGYCQKCECKGHATYACQATSRPYKSRPTASMALLNAAAAKERQTNVTVPDEFKGKSAKAGPSSKPMATEKAGSSSKPDDAPMKKGRIKSRSSGRRRWTPSTSSAPDMLKGKARSQPDGPVVQLLDQDRKSAAQEKWLKEALQVIASPLSVVKTRLAALAKVEKHMAKTVLSGNSQKAATWWRLQQNNDCNVASVLLPHLHVLHLHLALVGASLAKSSSSRRSEDDGLVLAVSSLSDVDLLAEEIVISLSLLQGLVVCDRNSRAACAKRVSLESILLVLSAPHLVEKDLTAPACHALDLLMCILVDSDEDVSDMFESLGGVDQISSVWKARAENVAMRRAAARVEREAARLRGPDFNPHRRNRSGPTRTVSDGPVTASPGKHPRRGYSEDFDGGRPSTPRARSGGLSPISSPQRAVKKTSTPPAVPASPAGPTIPQRSSSAVSSPETQRPDSPEAIYRGRGDVFSASRQSLGLVRSGNSSEEEKSSSWPKPTHSGSQDAADGGARHRPNSRRAMRAEEKPAKNDDGREAEEDEPDELCEKCIEFLIFYLQPELLEREAERERRMKDKMASAAVLQLGAPRRSGAEKIAAAAGKAQKREQGKPAPVPTRSKVTKSAEPEVSRSPAKQRSSRV
ncbi:unnamed protein product [Tilletia caries]|nr:unnamed protein product [Tilletia caries]